VRFQDSILPFFARNARGESRYLVRLLVPLASLLSLSLSLSLSRSSPSRVSPRFPNRAIFDIDARPSGRVSLRFSPDRRICRALAGVICGVARCASCSRFNTTSVCARSACSVHYERPPVHASCAAILPIEWSKGRRASVVGQRADSRREISLSWGILREGITRGDRVK